MGEKDQSAYFPLFMNLEDKKIVVVGAGNIGSRRILTLSEFPCHMQVIAKEVSKEIRQLQESGRIQLSQRAVREEDLEDAFLVIAATDDPNVNDWVIKNSTKACFVNHVGDKKQSNFYFPGIIKDENYVIGVTASGKDHKGARKATEFIRNMWEKNRFDY